MGRIHTFQIGDFHCAALNDGQSEGTAQTYLANAPLDQAAQALSAYGLQTDRLPSWMNPLYIHAGQHHILCDTGLGRGDLAENLAQLGITPEQITAVIITHAHGDHIGGNTRDDGSPAFPNARYFIRQDEWDYWTDPTTLARIGGRATLIQKNLISIRDRFAFITADEEIVRGVHSLHTPGHTVGHIALLIQSEGDTLLHAVDALHQRVQTEYPDWSPLFDTDPLLAAQTRRRLLARIHEEGWLMYAYHFPFPPLGYLRPVGDVWRWEHAIS